jgi:hypothetical protein
MTQISRLITVVLSLIVLTASGFAQDRERPNRQNSERPQGNRPQENIQNMTPEQINQQQGQIVQEKIASFNEKMKGAIPEDKQEGIAALVKDHFVGEARLRVSGMLARQKAGDDREKGRAIVMGVRKKTEELISGTKAKAKKQLDKKTLQKFNQVIDELTPMTGQGGGGGGGRGGRGGSQGGGGGGDR